MVLLWDLQNLFDSIDVKILFAEAARVGFPLLQLALSMVVHHAPRRLKLGTAIGEPIFQMGRSILAGCSRSTDLARVYTLRMVKTPSAGQALPTRRRYQQPGHSDQPVSAHYRRGAVCHALLGAMPEASTYYLAEVNSCPGHRGDS